MTNVLGMEGGYQGNTMFQWSGNNVLLAQRFTSPTSSVISGISLFGGVNWTASDQTSVSIQGNNAGVPDGVAIANAGWAHGSIPGNGNIDLRFDSVASLLSGTIYHIVFQPVDTIGTGSLFRLNTANIAYAAGSKSSYWRLPGSYFQSAPDNNMLPQLSYDSGTTWSAGSVQSGGCQLSFLIHLSGAVPGDLNNFGIGRVGGNSSRVAGGSAYTGMLFRLDQDYDVSGVSVDVNFAGTGTGSLWCRVEYSGVMAGGVRVEIGSVFLCNNVTGQVASAQKFMHLSGGSIIYVWLYAPEGDGGVIGSRYIINSPAMTAATSFGVGSAVLINSGNAGSTVALLNNQDLPIFFFKSGATGATTSTPYLNRYGDSFTSINNAY